MPEQRHIFLSYRSIEADFALRLAADLKNSGVSVWMDRRDGNEWRRQIRMLLQSVLAPR